MLTHRVPPPTAAARAVTPRVPVLQGGRASLRPAGPFGRREGLHSATVSGHTDLIEVRAGDDLWPALHGGGRFEPSAESVLAHVPTLREVGAMWEVLVTDSSRPVTDSGQARMVVIDADTRQHLLARAGFAKQQRPLRRPAVVRDAGQPRRSASATIMGVAEHRVPTGRAQQRAIIRAVDAAERKAAHAADGDGAQGSHRPRQEPTPIFARAEPRFAPRTGDDHYNGVRHSRRRPHRANHHMPHSINSSYAAY